MSIEDSRISAVENENASHDLISDIHQDARLQTSALGGVEVAQAGTTQPSDQQGAQSTETTGRLPAAQEAAAAAPAGQVVPDQNNIAHLPAGTAIDDIHVRGNDLVLVQANGTEIVIVNGALHVPTFLLGEVELPQQAVIAALEQSNINVAAGPDGSYSASSSPSSSGANFQDSIQGNGGDPTQLASLLADTQQADSTPERTPDLNNDTPTALANAVVLLDDSSLPGGNGEATLLNTTGTLGFLSGNDGIGSVLLTGAGLATSPAGEGSFFQAVGADGRSIVISQVQHGTNITVLTVTLSDTTSGIYTIVQNAAIQHAAGQGENTQAFTIGYQVRDQDGDIANGTLTLNVKDDVIAWSPSEDSNTTVDEHNLGNGGEMPVLLREAVSSSSTTASGDLHISWGADNYDVEGANDGVGRSLVFASAAGDTSAQVAAMSAVDANGETVALTSNSIALTYTLSENGTTLVATAEGQPIFTVTLNDDGSGTYEFTLTGPLDNKFKGTDALTLTFHAVATDSDGDAVPVYFSVAVADDIPVNPSDATLSVDEHNLASGAIEATGHVSALAPGADGYQGGSLATAIHFTTVPSDLKTTAGVAIDVTQSGNVLTGTVHGTNTVAFTLTVNADGTYKYVQNVALSHPTQGTDVKEIGFGFTITDGDGDVSAPATITVKVTDDVAASNQIADATANHVGEMALTTKTPVDNTITGSLINGKAGDGEINFGADGYKTGSLAFDGTAGQPAVTSHGETVRYVLSGNTLYGYVSSSELSAKYVSEHSGVQVFKVVLDPATASYSFTLLKPLDHVKGDDLSLGFKLTAQDGDTDAVKFTLNLHVDDANPVGAQVNDVNTTIDEHAILTGNPLDEVRIGSVVEGFLSNGAVDFGPDGYKAGSLSFGALNGQPQFTSGGAEVHYAVVGNTLYGYVGAAPQAGHVPSQGSQVFTLSLAPALGGYAFELKGAIDHLGGDAVAKELSFALTGKDYDGDTVNIELQFHIKDDVPTTPKNATLSVDEHNLASGAIEATGHVSALAPGADGYQGGSLATAIHFTPVSSELKTTAGVAIDVTQSGNVLTGTVHGTNTVAFTLTVNADGTYKYVQNVALSHPTQGTDVKEIGFGFTITDGDGDVSAPATITVKVTDDVAASNQIADATANHVGEMALTTKTPVDNTITGSLINGKAGDGEINFGADGYKTGSLAFDGTAGQPAVTSHGETVRYVLSGNTLYGYVSSSELSAKYVSEHSGVQVFKVVLDPATASYSFTLLKPLDHVKGDDLSLGFKLTAQDGDTDAVKFTLNLHVDDANPVGAQVNDVNTTIDEHAILTGNPLDEVRIGSVVEGFLSNGAVDFGPDGYKAGSLSFGALNGQPQFTSGGAEVHYAVVGNTLYGYVGAAPQAGHVPSQGSQVFTLSLAPALGGYAFELKGAIDHLGGDAVAKELSFALTGKDYDGDTVNINLQFHIKDDVPTIGTPTLGHAEEVGSSQILANGTFEQDRLAAGLPGVQPDTRGNYSYNAPTGWTITGGIGGLFAPAASIVSAEGHDGGNVVWLHSGATLARDTGTTLVAGQVYSLHFDVGNRTDQDFGGGVAKLIATNGNQTVVLSQITLTEPADGKWGSVDLNSPVIGSDYAGWHLSVEITQTSGTGNQILIDDVELRQFTPSVATGSLGISWGADNNVDLRGVTFDTQQPTGLTSNGDAIHYTLSANNTLLTAISADGRTIFTVELSKTTGQYKLTLIDTLDHPSVPQGGLQFAFTATDADGDPAHSHFTVTVADDKPVLTNADGISQALLSESGIVAVGTQPAGTDAGHGNVTSGNLAVNFGADGFGSTAFSGGFTVNGGASRSLVAGAPGVDSGLTSDKRAIFFSLSSDAHTIEGRTESGEVILRAVLDQGDAGWKVTLLGNIDHQPGNTGLGADQSLSFGVIAKDGDGDSVNLTLSTTIHDDKPVINGETGTETPVFTASASEDSSAITFNLHEDNKVSFGADGPGAVDFDFDHATITTPAGMTVTLDQLVYSYDQTSGVLKIEPGSAFNALGKGDVATLTVPFTVTDADGDSKSAVYQVTIHGANDNPIANDDVFSSVPNGWTLDAASGHAYTFKPTDNSETWDKARVDAAQLLADNKSYLATITSAHEQNVVLGVVNHDGGKAEIIAYLGGTDEGHEGHWVWATGPEAGQPFVYTNWDANEPNNSNGNENILWLYGQFRDGVWNDAPSGGLAFGGYQFGFVAEAGEPGSYYAAINEDHTYKIDASLLLANDKTVDIGEKLSVIGFDQAGAKAAISAMGAAISFDGTSFSYDASASAQLQHLAEGEKTTDTFTYTISDGQGGFSTATVTVT
ncbi:DUF5801 repeats-in-toxin domain-containing protein, partial [Rhizobium sp.]|uniref:T1SS-143 repeat domain-containing protein n=1 Tax=Rhizobium sp. TaxID=391 RepID=UPI0028ADA598